MNTIAVFRKCTLSDADLLKKVDRLTDQMYQNGKIPDRQIPARPDEDYDLLVGELILRFEELLGRALPISYTPKCKDCNDQGWLYDEERLKLKIAIAVSDKTVWKI